VKRKRYFALTRRDYRSDKAVNIPKFFSELKRRNVLEKTYQDRDGYNIAYIKVDPFFDPLRGDPRFEVFVQKIFAPKDRR